MTDAREEQVVTDSGGTMRRFTGPVAPEVEADLEVLEPLRVPYDAAVRTPGTAPFLEAGSVVSWHYALGVDVLRVVRDDERGLVAWLPAGSERLAVVPRDGKGLRQRSLDERAGLAASRDYDRLTRTWDGTGILRVAPTGVPWSLWYFWEDDGSFAGHYVNLELVHQRPVSGEARVLTRDLTLDLWLDAGGSDTDDGGGSDGSDDAGLWLKDEDELAAFTRAGLFTAEQAGALLALADRVRAELVEARAWPLDEEWESWRPPTDMDRPLMLADAPHLETR
ncbi:DUF402 domain-containing protein [Nocardioides sp. P5_C9_2]